MLNPKGARIKDKITKLRLPTPEEVGSFGFNANVPTKLKQKPVDVENIYKEEEKPAAKKLNPRLLEKLKSDFGSDKSTGFYTKGEQNIAKKVAAEKGYTEKQSVSKTKGGKLIVGVTKEYLDVAHRSDEDIDFDIKYDDLDKASPYTYFSTLDDGVAVEDDADVNAVVTKKDNFVDKTYSIADLKDLGIDPKDFDGFLNIKGYKNELIDLEESGVVGGKGINTLSGNDRELSLELKKKQYLDAYIKDTNDRATKYSNLLIEKQNKSLSTEKQIKRNKSIQLFDPNSLAEYQSKYMPRISAIEADRKEKEAKIYSDIVSGNRSYLDVASNMIGYAGRGFLDAINKYSTTLLESIGMHDTAEATRLLSKEREINRPDDRSVSYASGKAVLFNGKKYIVDDDDNIYDADNKLRVGDLLDKKYADTIISSSKTKGVDDSLFSFIGAANATANIAGAMIPQLALAKGVGLAGGTALEGLTFEMGVLEADATSIIAQGMIGASEGYENTLRLAREAGISEKEARALAMDASQRMGALYTVTAPISPNIKAKDAIFGNEIKDLTKKAIQSYVAGGEKTFAQTLQNGLRSIAKSGVVFAEEGAKEAVQENIQQASEIYWNNALTNKRAGKEIAQSNYSFDEFVNTSALSFLTGGALSQLKMPSLSKGDDDEKMATLFTLGKNQKDLEKNLSTLVGANVATQEEADKLKSDAIAVYNNHSKIPKGVSAKGVIQMSRKLQEINDLESTKKTLSPAFHNDIDAQIKSKLDEVSSMYTTDLFENSLAGKDVNNLVKAIESIDPSIELNMLEDDDAVETFLISKGYNQEDAKNSKEANGAFIEATENSPELIFINKKRILERGIFTTGQHEFLHKVLVKAVSNNPELAVHLGKSLWETVDKHLGGNLEFTNIGKRLYEYQKRYEDPNGDYSFSSYLEEVLPLVSEALTSGELKIEESKSFIDAIRTAIYKALNLIGVDISPKLLKLDTGEDVLNFIKDYNKGFAKGEFSKAIKTLAQEGKFKEIAIDKMNIADDNMFYRVNKEENAALPKIKNNVLERAKAKRDARLNGKLSVSYSSPNLSFDEKMAELQSLADDYEIDEDEYQAEKANLEIKERLRKKKEASNDVKPEVTSVEKTVSAKESDEEKIVKDNKGSIASDKVQSIYYDKGVAGAFEIIELFKPIVKKLVDKRRDAPGFDRQLLTDEIETGVNGLYDLINSYNPDSNVPLAAYINKYLPLRAIEASRRVLDKEFSSEATDQVMYQYNESTDDDYSFDSTLDEMRDEEEYQSLLINPIDIMGEKLAGEYQAAVNKVVEGMNPEELAKLTFANLNDIAPEITSKFFGISVNKATNSAANLSTGEIEPIQKIIFENRVKLIKLLPDGAILEGATARESLINTGLSIPRNIQREFYDQKPRLGKGAGLIPFELKKNITQRDFLKAFGINEDGTVIKFNGKDSRAQTMLAMIRLYGKIASNTGVRQTALQTIEQQIDLRAGAAKIQLSLGGPFQDSPESQKKYDTTYKNGITDVTFNRNGINVAVGDLTNSLSGNQKFYVENLEEFLDVRDKFIETLPKQLTSELGQLHGLVGDSYRTTGWYVNFNKNGIKKLVDNKGNIVKGDRADAIVERLKAKSFNSKLNGEYSEKYNENVKEYIDAVENAMKDVPSSFRGNTAINKTKKYNFITVINENTSGNVLSNPYVSNVLKLNDVNKAKAELFIAVAREFVNDNSISGTARESRIKMIANMLYSNSNLVDGFRALSSITGAVIDISDPNVKYTLEHEKAMVLVIPEVLDQIINSSIPISFDSTAIFVPEQLAKSRNKTPGLKTSDEKVYNEFKDKEIANNDSYVEVKGTPGKLKLSLSDDFNNIIEDVYSVDAKETLSAITARKLGYNKGKFRFFIPPSAEDFVGLLYDFMGKGAKGDEHAKFFQDNLVRPYIEGVQRIDVVRNNIREGYKALKSKYPNESKKIKEAVDGTTFTYDQAIRVYLWKTNGVEIPGLSNKEINRLASVVQKDAGMRAFADELSAASGQINGWVEPGNYWNARSIVSDLHDITEKTGRRNILSEFIENSNEIFSETNLNKIESILGSKYRSALEESLSVMKNGGLGSPGDNISKAWTNWIANANGAIMFLNVRSTILQTIAATNYLNWKENNPIAAAKAFANQPQYWKDFAKIFNSPKLKERRSGLKSDVNEAELANAVNNSQDKARAALSYILKLGYTPTQIADSFAIAIGGATYYRNKLNAYVKSGMSEADAEIAAWDDFDNATEETQQSSDPMRLSQQQRSTVGRLILAFANAPLQYNRIMKKAFRDLKNGRGDTKTNISKILYYGAAQNIMFSAIQSGLFYLLFDDEEEEDKDKAAKKSDKNKDKLLDTVNSMADTILRGAGIGGAVVSTAKNVYMKYKEEDAKARGGDQLKTFVAAAGISPPLGSKVSKAYSAYRTGKFEKDVIDKQGWGVTLDGKFSLSPRYEQAGKAITAATNLPADYIVDKINSVQEILDSRNKTWQKIAIGLGWKPFEVGAINEEREVIKAAGKIERKKAGIEKRKATNALKSITKQEKKVRELDSIANLPEDQIEQYYLNDEIKKQEEKVRKLDSIANLPEDQINAYYAKKESDKKIAALKRKIKKSLLNK